MSRLALIITYLFLLFLLALGLNMRTYWGAVVMAAALVLMLGLAWRVRRPS